MGEFKIRSTLQTIRGQETASGGSDQSLASVVRAASVGVPSRVRKQRRDSGSSSSSGSSTDDSLSSKSSSQVKHSLSFDELPDYLKKNEFITRHYRGTMGIRESLWSVFGYHNETGNIWTHLIGFLLFGMLTVYVATLPATPRAFAAVTAELNLSNAINSSKQCLEHGAHIVADVLHHLANATGLQPHQTTQQQQPLQDPAPRWPLYLFMAGAMACLLFSSTCHLLACCRQHVSTLIWRFDYAGIALLIVTSFFPPVYYGFLCLPWWRNFYLISTSCMGLATLRVCLASKYQQSQYRSMRTTMFVVLGLWGSVPLLHQVVLNHHADQVRVAVVLDAIMGAIYVAGAVIYAMRLPERWRPGAFDVFLHSHQIFHVAVVVAALLHFRASMLMVEWRAAVPCGCT